MEKNSIVYRIKWKKAAEKITFLPPQVGQEYFTEIEKKAMVPNRVVILKAGDDSAQEMAGYGKT